MVKSRLIGARPHRGREETQVNKNMVLYKDGAAPSVLQLLDLRRFLRFSAIFVSSLIFALFAAFPQTAFALTGDGTQESPYLIATADDLAEFRDIVNGTHSSVRQNSEAHARLTNDINLPTTDWTPIGDEENHSYSGTFYGCGYTISGLMVANRSSAAGLFGYLGGDSSQPGGTTGAVVKNLNVSGEVRVGSS